jgi:hypothetical protein
MDPRFDANEVTYADIAIEKVDERRIIAGVQLSKRTKTEDGRVYHEPYHVLSLYYDDLRAATINQSITTVCYDALKCVDAESRLVIFRSCSKVFQRYKKFESEIGVLAVPSGITVKVQHKPELRRIISDLMRLGNDALERGFSLDSAI